MHFIEALKLKSKLLLLFIFITFGLVAVGVLGTTHINAMKKNIDSLYFGSLVPVNELNNIVQTYHNGLADTIYKASRGKISPSETISSIELSLEFIDKKWHSYMGHFKRYDEMSYVEYANSEIEATNIYFNKLLKAIKNGTNPDKISINLLEKKVFSIHQVLKKLIKYETDVAKYERRNFLYTYKSMMQQLSIILSIIIAGVLLVSLYVFKSIQQDHTNLEKIAKKLKIANKKLENVSYTDSLTNLYNRRYFNLVYDRELKRAKRDKTYITFMMLDIDFFKQYNDTYGHIEGDFALKSVAKVLKDTLKRPTDFVFRLGGEEFGILLSEADESSSAKLARDICDAIRARKIKHENSKVHEYLTVSIGVVCCVADDALEDEILISRADEMLYKAKESGRNGYIITSNASKITSQITNEQNLAAC